MLCYRCGSYNPDGSLSCKQCGQQFVDSKRLSKSGTAAEVKVTPRLTRKTLEDIGATLRIGELLVDRYEIRDVLGVGPIGTVYRAHDTKDDFDVALKVISPTLLTDHEESKRFLAAIRTSRKLNHPNVARIYDCNQINDTIFITMQLLEGLSLRKIIKLRKEKNQQFLKKEIEPIFSHLCQVLGRAHRIMVHGDLKPDNIIILPNTLMITDFGMFMALPQKNFVIAQMGFANRGSYLAPEIRSRDSTITIGPTADTYSLGVILCEILTGKIYEGSQALLPPLPEEHKTLAPLLNKTLRQNPAQRTQTVHEFFDELHRAIGGVRPDKAPPRPAPARSAASVPPVLPSKRRKTSPGIDVRESAIAGDPHPPTMPSVKAPSPDVAVAAPPTEPPPTAKPQQPSAPPPSDTVHVPLALPITLPVAAQSEAPEALRAIPSKPPLADTAAANRSTVRLIWYLVHGVIVAVLIIGGFLLERYIHSLQTQLESAQQALRKMDHVNSNGAGTNPATDAHQAGDLLMYAGFCAPDRAANCQEMPWAAAAEHKRSQNQPGDAQKLPGKPDGTDREQKSANDKLGSEVRSETDSHSPVTGAANDTKKDCMPGMVEIPAGKALLGSAINDPLRNFGEDKLHSMNMQAFCVDRYEYPNEPKTTPLVGVSYSQAEQLCKKRGKRLCTEEEWEYACNGGGSRSFPYGDHFDPDICNTRDGNGRNRSIAPSGKYEKCTSPFGVFDMSGNASEWTSSPGEGDNALRGGSFSRPNWAARCAARGNLAPTSQKDDVGLRCCADPH